MADMGEVFSRLRRRWMAPPLDTGVDLAAATRAYDHLLEALRLDRELRRLSAELYPEVARSPDEPGTQGPPDAESLPELHAVNQMLRIMKDVWVLVRADRSQAQLLSQGWMNVFRRWTSAPTFRRHWPRLRSEYSREFLRFCHRELGLSLGVVEAVPFPVEWEPADVAAIALLENDLRLEWPEFSLRARITDATRPMGDGPSPAWLIWMNDGEESPRFACGVILAWPADEDVEFFVWVRPAFRNFGIGRRCVGEVLESLCRDHYAGVPRGVFTLRVRFPDGDRAGVRESEAVALWLNFFYHYWFRRRGGRDRDRVPDETSRGDLVLYRRSDAVEWHREARHGPASS